MNRITINQTKNVYSLYSNSLQKKNIVTQHRCHHRHHQSPFCRTYFLWVIQNCHNITQPIERAAPYQGLPYSLCVWTGTCHLNGTLVYRTCKQAVGFQWRQMAVTLYVYLSWTEEKAWKWLLVMCWILGNKLMWTQIYNADTQNGASILLWSTYFESYRESLNRIIADID